jgi:hypothetical protein
MLGNGAVQNGSQQLDPKYVRDENLIADLINGGKVPVLHIFISLEFVGYRSVGFTYQVKICSTVDISFNLVNTLSKIVIH